MLSLPDERYSGCVVLSRVSWLGLLWNSNPEGNKEEEGMVKNNRKGDKYESKMHNLYKISTYDDTVHKWCIIIVVYNNIISRQSSWSHVNF